MKENILEKPDSEMGLERGLKSVPSRLPYPLSNEERGLSDLGHGRLWNHDQAWSLLTKIPALVWNPGTHCAVSLLRYICTILSPTRLRQSCRQGPGVIHLVILNAQFLPKPVWASRRPSSCLILQPFESICPGPMHKPSHPTLPLHMLIPLPSSGPVPVPLLRGPYCTLYLP